MGVGVDEGVRVGVGVLDAVMRGVSVGVQVGGSVILRVAVSVGKESATGCVGGGKGLYAELGLIKIIKKRAEIPSTHRIRSMVNIFHNAPAIPASWRAIRF
jgi:hypothetical protein